MKQIICCIALWCVAATANACDVCGGAAGGQGLGILPMYYRNFAGLQYQYRSFNSVQEQVDENKSPGQSREYYNTVQVWGRVHVSKRVQLFAFLPYQFNRRSFGSTAYNYNGAGDVSVWANATVLKTEDDCDCNWRHMLVAGGGLKAPTGKYASHANDKADILNIMPGTGTWDFALNANYTLRYRKAGINTEASYTLTTADAESYKYGNKLTAALRGFYALQYGRFTILPQAGLRSDYSLHDYDNYKRKWLNEQSGGYILYATAGAQAYYGRVGLQVSYNKPVAQHYGGGNVKALQFADGGLFFLF